jgi:aminoglycoside 3-N-acetyltransferase
VHSRSSLADDFRRLGVRAGDTVMLHASVRAVGEVAGGPDQIHLALSDALTTAGTLLMYVSCPRHFDEIGRGNLTADQERELLEKLPPFDAHTARAARDNAHVARFAARGRQADYLFSEQPWDYAFGRGSALERFAALDGRILLLGCDHDNVTFLHYAEHIVEVPNKRIARFTVPVLEEGRRVWREMEEFDTADGAHAQWPAGTFAKIVTLFLSQTGMPRSRVGDADTYLLPARGLLDVALAELRNLAARDI